MPELSTADHGTSPPRVRIPRQYNAAWDLIQRNLQAGRGGKAAFIDDAGSYTYGELAERVNRFGNVLAGLGMQQEERVMLCLLDTIDFPTAFLGSIQAGIVPIALIFLLVFGGIYGGLFTPTEGAAVGAASTFVAALLKREITWKKFKVCFYATAESSAMIFLIFIGADVMNSALTLTQVPAQLAAVINSWGLAPLVVVTAIMLFYVVLGAVMDELSMILLTIPIFFPMIMGMDFGMSKEYTAIWFGIMVLMTVGFGMLAPPVGLNVYVVNGMAKDVPMSESYKGVMPFLISDTIRTTVLLLFPGISLFLVKYVS